MKVREYVEKHGDEKIIVVIPLEFEGEFSFGEMEYYEKGVLHSNCPNGEEYDTEILEVRKGEKQTILIVK